MAHTVYSPATQLTGSLLLALRDDCSLPAVDRHPVELVQVVAPLVHGPESPLGLAAEQAEGEVLAGLGDKKRKEKAGFPQLD